MKKIRLKSNKISDFTSEIAKENKLLLPISRRSPPFYNVVTIVEISAKTTLKTLHKQLNSTIKKAVKKYVSDVKLKKFPNKKEMY